MGINVERAISQANTISQFASELNNIRNLLTQNHTLLNQAWSSPEIAEVNRFLSSLFTKLTINGAELNGISSDISYTAHEIRREEEAARLAAERAAREAAAREAARQAAMRQMYSNSSVFR